MDCLQGIITNDIVKPGPGSLVYGAFLTPKGAVIADCWVIRAAAAFLIVVDAEGRERTAALLRRQLPPRLARTTDRTDELAVVWILGRPGAAQLPTPLGPLPAPGRVATIDRDGAAWQIAAGTPAAAFVALVVLPAVAVEAALTELEGGGGGAVRRDEGDGGGSGRGGLADLRVARVMAGVPTLGAEIDDRTFPQEVDFDRLEGVSYSKGCYVGQETVARIHFRGHPNWLLRGVEAQSGWDPVDELREDGKPIARFGTLVRLEDGEVIGLSLVRREIGPGTSLGEGAARILVTELPHRRR